MNPLTASQYLVDPQYMEKTLRLAGAQPMDTVQVLIDERPHKFEECVAWARNAWQELFHNQIRQLLYNFPADQVGGKK